MLPFLLKTLPKPEFGMYFVFLSVTGLLPVLDFGFSAVIARFLSYAMAGATSLQAQGLAAAPTSPGTGPNYGLLWQLLRTTRVLYRYLSVISFIVMGIWGTVLVRSKITETTYPGITWIAWCLTLFASTVDMYFCWWNVYLSYIDRIRQSARIAFWGYTLRILITCILLLSGAGLLSFPVATLVGSLTSRGFARRDVLRTMGPKPAGLPVFSQRFLLRLLWPNSWRTGLQGLSAYLRTNANMAICLAVFGLGATAKYGFSVQVMNVAMGMAGVWTFVKWPEVGQLRAAHNFPALRRLLGVRLWLQAVTFVALAGAAIFVGPILLQWIHTDKQMLPTPWLILLGVGFFLDMIFIFWGTLLSVENRIPTLWSTVITNVGCLMLAYGLSRYTHIGVPALVLAPLLTGLVFNYWYWPLAGARSLRTTWLRFTLCSRRAGNVSFEPELSKSTQT
jgi:hypothetical protein